MSDNPTIRPIFEPVSAGLDDHQAKIITGARTLAAERFAPRAEALDRDAVFPTENYRDLHEAGLLAICIAEADGGLGADFKTYMLAAAEIGRFCGATALTWNMHVCSCLWTGALADDLDMSEDDRATHRRRRQSHYKR
ncbi:MAG: acyl-CoA dehydrogenase family protein, partial [Geminicoccaceae bacterium]